MGKIKVSCPKCSAHYNIDEAQMGKKGRCKRCTTTFVLTQTDRTVAQFVTLRPDPACFTAPLKLSDVARVVGLTHAFITVRLLRGTQVPIEADSSFAEAAADFESQVLKTREALDVAELQEKVGNSVAKKANPLTGLLRAGHVIDFAKNPSKNYSVCWG